MIKYPFPYYLNDTCESEGEIIREIMNMTKCNVRTAKKIIAMVKESKK